MLLIAFSEKSTNARTNYKQNHLIRKNKRAVRKLLFQFVLEMLLYKLHSNTLKLIEHYMEAGTLLFDHLYNIQSQQLIGTLIFVKMTMSYICTRLYYFTKVITRNDKNFILNHVITVLAICLKNRPVNLYQLLCMYIN